jgi:ATP-binding cassette, subfamily B, multidrug efflux pump
MNKAGGDHMNNLHKEDDLGKAYDSRLMARLLGFAKPYWVWLSFCVVLLMIIAGIDLARPYIIKIAIDDYINVYNKPIYVFQDKPSDLQNGVSFKNNYYLRTKNEDIIEESDSLAQLIQYKGSIFLVEGYLPLQGKEYEIISENKGYIFRANGQQFEAYQLNQEEIKNFRKQDIKSIKRLSLLFLVIIFFALILNYIQVYLLHFASNKIVFNIRHQVFSHLQNMSLKFFDRNPIGRLVTRVTNDTDTLNEMYTGVLVNLFKDIFLLIGIVLVMLRMNIKLALISFVVVPIIVLAAGIFRVKVRHVYREVRVKLAAINAALNENITGMKTVHIFKKEEKQFKEFNHINEEHFNANKKEILLFAVFRPSMEIISSLGMAVIIWYGGGQVLRGTIQFGVLFAFVNYLKQFFQPINDLTEKYNILQSAMASSERIFALLDQKPDIVEEKESIKAVRLKGEIEFKNVWFAYTEEDWVLKNVSFKIKEGESIAFVGSTGAGKSSIVNLIGRFYDIQKGEILLDGVNIKEFSLKALRQNMGIVLQDVFMFTGTVKDNIVLNNKEIPLEKVKEIAQFVNAHQFIEKLPQQYEESVMERGAAFSTGQRQLLAFARALVMNPSILILDEATSNIDTETEQLIQDAVSKLIKGRTTIAVAHRLSTIQKCDKIIVLHKGEIREAGNHQDLLRNEGIYYKLYQLQYKESFTL